MWSMGGAEVLAAIDEVERELNRLQTYRLNLLATLDSIGYAAEVGARDTAELVATRHHLDATAVRRDLRLATALAKYPTVESALSARALHAAQAEAIVTALERIPPTTVPVEDLRVAEAELVKAGQLLPPADLRRLGKRVRDTLDTDGTEPAEERAYRNESLWLKQLDTGVQFGGFLACENGELLRTLVFAAAKPHRTKDGHRDPRSCGKRQADALTTILTSAATTGTAVPSHGDIKPHITVTIDYDSLRQGEGVGTLAHGGTLSAGAIRRLACDAGIIPLVLGSNSEPLDLGTQQRFVNRALRRALNARDKGCIVCGAPPAICEAHHLRHWTEGGPTNLTNLALLCKAHHIAVHQGHYTITVTNGRPTVTTPPWTTPTPDNPTRSPATRTDPALRPWAAPTHAQKRNPERGNANHLDPSLDRRHQDTDDEKPGACRRGVDTNDREESGARRDPGMYWRDSSADTRDLSTHHRNQTAAGRDSDVYQGESNAGHRVRNASGGDPSSACRSASAGHPELGTPSGPHPRSPASPRAP
ncbi:HNH endonuclease [Kribbella amoyensis]|uniref:HNH endonuclease n=2 Tax=Kribbella amoyensis TaxID=996641 RepID=A0A561B8H2_9ACTN|nr:HNH endonuclease [Kribbella amoyensis]